MGQRRAYPSDLNDKAWERIQHFFPAAKPGGRPRSVAIRDVVNAILYVLRSGCAWRLLPHEYPKWQTVYWYFRRWIDSGLWVFINDALRADYRMRRGRNPEPSGGIIDSQSVKTIEKGGHLVGMGISKSKDANASW